MRGRFASRYATVRVLPTAAPASDRVAAAPARRTAGPLGHPGRRPRAARRRLRVRWGRLVAIVLGVYLAAGLVAQQVAYGQAQRELRALRAEVQRVAEENRALRERIQFLRGGEYIDAAARERLGLIRPGETVIQIVEPGAAGTSE
ncbi:MAG: hypothetical protein DIU69_01775 [Bacillota bacterium]|nr:MAG: hypothetical protein DIU69_01775 [Bacillota bacterium]